ncbi:hypothetical protein AeNC1_003628 [Aphanomyces euteiches]|nr:hypothetical protein AeNC1_003628 [Aphanomyces euteiches]
MLMRESPLSASQVSCLSDYDFLALSKSEAPDDVGIGGQGGALRPGGAPLLRSKEVIGLLCQYWAIGFVLGGLKDLRLPVFNYYFNLPGYQITAASALVALGWSFKVFIGLVSDCIPLCGYRRKGYMLLGWTLCLAFTLSLALVSWSGQSTILLSMGASFGSVIAVVASDAVLVDMAQREPVSIRGQLQTAMYSLRTIGNMAATLLVGVGLNSSQYGGHFTFSLSLSTFFWCLAIPSLAAIPCTICLVVEPTAVSQTIRAYAASLWSLLQSRVVWQILLFKFWNHLFHSIGSTATPGIAKIWCRVQPINSMVAHIVGFLFFLVTLVVTGRYGLQWNWRTVIWSTTIAVTGIDATVTYLIIFNVIRSEWFYLGVPLAEQFPIAVAFMVATFMSVEVADLGNEGVVYGLLTTVSNLTAPVSAMLTNLISAFFDIETPFLILDTPYVRSQVAISYAIAYGTTGLALVALVLCPRQKAELQALKQRGERSPIAGAAVVVGVVGCLAIAVASNVMSVSSGMSCSIFAGGKGC